MLWGREWPSLIKIQMGEKSSIYERAAVHVRVNFLTSPSPLFWVPKQHSFFCLIHQHTHTHAENTHPLTHSPQTASPLPLILLLQSTNSHFNRFHLRMWVCGKNSTIYIYPLLKLVTWGMWGTHFAGGALFYTHIYSSRVPPCLVYEN